MVVTAAHASSPNKFNQIASISSLVFQLSRFFVRELELTLKKSKPLAHFIKEFKWLVRHYVQKINASQMVI